MKTYRMTRHTTDLGVETCDAWVIQPGKMDRTLDSRLDIRNHSPAGIEWGYNGSGPAQLALALLADASGDARVAELYYQRFKADVVCPQVSDGWEVTSEWIMGWLWAARSYERQIRDEARARREQT